MRHRWHLIYYVLAAFDLIIISLTLYSDHYYIARYADVVSIGTATVATQNDLSDLLTVAQRADAPGNEVLVSRAVARERALFDDASRTFEEQFARTRAGLLQLVGARDQQEWAARIDETRAAMGEMRASAAALFAAVEARDEVGATVRMAEMDRQYARIVQVVERLRRSLRERELQVLRDHEARLGGSRRFEILIGLLFSVAVLGVALYGSLLSRLVKKAQEKEGYLAAIVADASDAILSVDLGERITSWNRNAEWLLGYSAEEALGQPASMLVPAHLRAERRDLLSELKRSQGVHRPSTQVLTKGGKVVDVDLSISPIRSASGALIGAAQRMRDISELKLAEQQLVEAQAIARIGSWSSDLAAPALSCSRELYKIFEIEDTASPEEVWAQARGRVLPEEVPRLAGLVRRAAETGEGFTTDFRVLGNDGALKHLRGIAKVARDSQGRPLKLSGTCQDITDAELREESRRRLVEMRQLIYRIDGALLEAASPAEVLRRAMAGLLSGGDFALACYWRHDASAGELTLTEHACAGEEGPFGEFLAQSRARRFTAGHGLPGRVLTSAGFASIASLDCDKNFPRKDAAARCGLRSAFAFAVALDGRVEGVIEVFSRESNHRPEEVRQDFLAIGARIGQRIAHLLRDEENRFILDALGIGVWKYNPATREVSWDRSMYRLFGLRQEDFASDRDAWERAVSAEVREELRKELERALRGEKEFRPLYEIETPRHEVRHIGAMSQLLRNTQGEPVMVYGVTYDRTREVLAERELEMERVKSMQNAKLASLGEVAAGIAHEINNPLAIISGAAHVLPQFLGDPPKLTSRIEMIQKASDRIARIVGSLKRFSRSGDRGERAPHPLRRIVEEAMTLLDPKARRHATPVEVQLRGDAVIVCDDIEIEQVLINLVSNGIDAVKHTEERWVRIEAFTERGQVVIQVRDSGRGISPEVRSRLFQPFFTTKAVGEGTGLGLSIARGILEEHGATIELLPQERHTCFEIRFPGAEVAPHAA